jgi:hypothetical protein
MQSISTTAPSVVSKCVSSTRVPSRYLRVILASGAEGAISHRPFSGVPRRAAKQAAASKRGMLSQSIEPLRATSAAVSQLPMIA